MKRIQTELAAWLLVGAITLTTAAGCKKQETSVSENSIQDSVLETSQAVATPESSANIEKIQLACDAIDTIVRNDVDHGFTSAQVAVMYDGDLLFSGTWGKVNSYDADGQRIASAADVTTDTLYDLASNTKMYSVAYAVQYLVTNGKLNLDDKIVDIIGDTFVSATILPDGYPTEAEDLDQIKSWKSTLTVRDVMCHRAGFEASPCYNFKNYDYAKGTSLTELANPLFSGYDGSQKTRALTLQKICETPLQYAPHSRVLYSDADYMLLCFVIEQVTGQRIDEFLQNTFWKPMGLTHITYNPLENGYQPNDCAATELHGNTRDGALSYEGVRTTLIQGQVHDEKAFYTMAGISGHAGMFANAEDLARLAYLMIDGTCDGTTYFSEDVLQQFTSYDDEAHQDWGIGWWREGEMDMQRSKYFSNMAPENVVGHQGWTGTLTCIDRENKLVIVVLTNKINSPVTNRSLNVNKFDGNWYTTADLGFAAKLIYSALSGDSLKDAQTKVLQQMEELDEIKYYQKSAVDGASSGHPAVEAYNSIHASYLEYKGKSE